MRIKMNHALVGEGRVLSQYFTIKITVSTTVLLALVLQVPFCVCSVGSSDYYDISTEPPEMVEWISTTAPTPQHHKQIQIKALRLETQVKLRYARTRIKVDLRNPHDKELQVDFKIILPENAFFTILHLKSGINPKTYAAEIVKKSVARNIYHFARTKTEGTVSAGYIELSPVSVGGLPCYNLKFTLSARENVQSFLVYERQLNRVFDAYSDRIQVFPTHLMTNSSLIDSVEYTVNVEELEGIQSLRCTNETQKNFPNCSSTVQKKRKWQGQRYRSVELTWRGRNVSAQSLEQHPFQFTYELEQQNDTTSAVMISQHNGNFYFVHLFVPKNLPVIRKHIIFLLDISDSMHGKKLEQLQWSMKEILDDLATDDFFNIIAFSNDIAMWSKFRGDMRKCPFPFPATETFKDSAVKFIEKELIAHGPTNIYLGLSSAFDLVRLFSPETEDTCPNATEIKTRREGMREHVQEKLPADVESMIFFLSDGRATSGPTDSTSLLKYFYELNEDENRNGTLSVQIHTIAYGEDADVDFLRALASLNGGSTKVIREESAAGIELANFYQEISLQVLSHLKTSVVLNDSILLPSARISSSSPVTVVKGSEVITAGQLLPQNGSSQIISSGAALNWSTEGIGKSGKLAYYNSAVYDCRDLQTTIGKCVQRIDYYLERLQAYQLLNKLLERDRLVEQGYICPKNYHDTFQDLKMERMRKEEDEEEYYYSDGRDNCYNIFKQQATELALKHRFVTPYTSFILTTEQVDNGLRDSDAVAGASSSEENSAEGVNNAVHTPGKTEKLIIMGSITPLETAPKPKLAPQFQVQTELLEVLPTASKIVSHEENKDDTFTSMTNTNNNTTNNASASGGLRLFAKSMRDFVVKTFQKLFRLPTSSEKAQQTTFNVTDLIEQNLQLVH